MRPWSKHKIREILRSPARYFSIMAIMALGVGFFAGLKLTKPQMLATLSAYAHDTSFFDYRLVSTLGLTEEDIVYFNSLPSVRAAEGSTSEDFITVYNDKPIVIRALSLTENVNKPVLIAGRMPTAAHECIADHYFFSEADIGKTLLISSENSEDPKAGFTVDGFQIVGIVSHPLFIDYERGTTALLNGTLSAYICVPGAAFDRDYYTEAYVSLLTDTDDCYADLYIRQAEAAEQPLKTALEERALLRYDTLYSDAQAELDEAQSEYDSEYAAYLEEKTDALQDLTDAASELSDAASELTDAETDLADAKQTLEDADTELTDAHNTLIESRHKLEAGDRELAAAKAEYNTQKAAFDAAEAAYLAEAEPFYASYDSNLSAIDAGLSEIAANKITVSEAIAAIEASGVLTQYEQLKSQRDRLSAAINAIPDSPERQALELQLQAVEQGIAEIEGNRVPARYAALQATLTQLNTTETDLQGKRAALVSGKAQLDAAGKEIEAARTQLSEGKAQIDANEKTLKSGWSKYSAGYKTYTQSLADYEQGKSDYEQGILDYEQGKLDYEQGLSDYTDASKEAEDSFTEADEEFASAAADLEKARKDLEEFLPPDTYVFDRGSNAPFYNFESNANIVESVAKVFPIFFFLVAAMVCMTTMTRMIDEQRTQIGALKALGFGNGAIVMKYVLYSGSASLLGALIGYFAGIRIFPMVIWNAYCMIYTFCSRITFVTDLTLLSVCIAAALICALSATILSGYAELVNLPAILMRPKAPKVGKKVFLEYIPFLWKRIPFLFKVSIRNMLRYKKRLFMMILGISGCTALIVTGFGVKSSVSGLAEVQYDRISRYDLLAVFSEGFQTAEDRETFLTAADDLISSCMFAVTDAREILSGGATRNVNIIAAHSDDFSSFITLQTTSGLPLTLPAKTGHVLITNGLAEVTGLGLGDEILIRLSEGKYVPAVIDGICENYVFHYIYMSPETYESLFDQEPEFRAVYAAAKTEPHRAAAALIGDHDAATVQVTADTRNFVANMMKSLDYVVLLVIFSAAALAYVVLFNLSNINITERIREIATIKVLGFYPTEVSSYVFRENILLVLISIIVGLPLGKLLHAFVMSCIKVDNVSFACIITPFGYVMGAVLTVVFAFIVNLTLRRKLNSVDMAESLKSAE